MFQVSNAWRLPIIMTVPDCVSFKYGEAYFVINRKFYSLKVTTSENFLLKGLLRIQMLHLNKKNLSLRAYGNNLLTIMCEDASRKKVNSTILYDIVELTRDSYNSSESQVHD